MERIMRYVMKWTGGGVLGMLLLVAGCQQSFDERLADEARAFTLKHCPQQLDDYTTLDSVKYDLATRTYRNYLTLDAAVPATLWDNLPLVKATLVHDLQNNAKWNLARKKGVTFEYVYRGGRLGDFSVRITPEDYGD